MADEYFERTQIQAVWNAINRGLKALYAAQHEVEQYALLKGWKKAEQCSLEEKEEKTRCEKCND